MWERNWDTTALRGIGDQDSMAWRPDVEQSVTVNAWILANAHAAADGNPASFPENMPRFKVLWSFHAWLLSVRGGGPRR